MNARSEIIDRIIKDLEMLQGRVSQSDAYAVQQNIIFFDSIKSPLKYLKWFFFQARYIKKEQLQELSDFGIEEWDKDLHRKLTKMARTTPPDLISPIRDFLTKLLSQEKDIRTVVDLGCGGMEIVRQVVIELNKIPNGRKFIFIGIDRSIHVPDLVRETFEDLSDSVEVKELEHLNRDSLQALSAKDYPKHLIVVNGSDIFELHNTFRNQSFDLIFHSRFRHHLLENQKIKLDNQTLRLGKHYVEFDEYKSWALALMQSFFTWKFPVLMNGAILSRVREDRKRCVVSLRNYNRIYYNNILGTYLKYKNN